jgi:hypothetical protein
MSKKHAIGFEGAGQEKTAVRVFLMLSLPNETPVLYPLLHDRFPDFSWYKPNWGKYTK